MQALLGESKFLENLQNFDKDNIPQTTIDKVRPYLELKEFDPETVKKASKAAFGLCSWVRAMEAYDRVAKVVEPKKKRLAEAEVEVAGLMASLAQKQAQLSQVCACAGRRDGIAHVPCPSLKCAVCVQVEERVAQLNATLEETQAKKAQLEADVDMCEKKLARATELIGGLGGEKSRWTEVTRLLSADLVNVTGDVLLAAGCIAYLGPFSAAFR